MSLPQILPIDDLAQRLRDAVAAERYEGAQELLAGYCAQVATEASRDPQVLQQSLELLKWAHSMVRSAKAQHEAQVAQLDAQAPYLSVESPRHTWQFDA